MFALALIFPLLEYRWHMGITKYSHIVEITLLSVMILLALSLSLLYLSIVLREFFAGNRQPDLVLLFVASLVFWTAGFHVILANFGYRISTAKLGWFSVFSKNWVKCIDYVYLIIGSSSLLRTVMGIVDISTDINGLFTAYSTVTLGTAIALRITKTSIEVFSWDKPPQSRGRATAHNS